MAKYADYATEDPIEAEIDEAAAATAARQDELPEQFKGKTAAEIAASYAELQEMNSRQSNELGNLRQTTTNLTNQLLTSSEPQPVIEPVTVDDLYADPDAVINRKVDERVSGKLEELEGLITGLRRDKELGTLQEKFPDYREKAKSTEMREWIHESGYRTRLAQASDSGDLQAAEDLFSMYNDLTGKQTVAAPDQATLNAATLESGTGDVHSPVEKFSRSKLELARRQAKMGNMEAQQFLAENADSIFAAYSEGRIVK